MSTPQFNFSSKNVAETYHSGLGPALFVPYAVDMAQRVKRHAPANVLEIACGTGIVTKELLAELSDARITATDFSPAMLEHAQTQLGANPNANFSVADMQALPFEDAAFDAVVCQFGIMFPPSKSKPMSEAFRVLKSGGRFFFSVWDRIENNVLPLCAKQVFDDVVQGPTPFPTPFHMHDSAAVQKLATDAGFDIEVAELLPLTGHAVPLHAAQAFSGFLDSVEKTAGLRTSDPAAFAAIVQRIADKIAAVIGSPDAGPVPLNAWVYVARKP